MTARSLLQALVAFTVTVTSVAACGGANSAADAAAGVADEPAGGAITQWTDSTELFMEHPALIVGACTSPISRILSRCAPDASR
jgi:hypothetical protein